MRRFAGRGVVITGAASGIGLATLRRFLGEGAIVLAVDRNAGGLEAALVPLLAAGADVHPFVADVSQAAQVDALVQEARVRLPRLDVLISNAGIATPEPFLTIEERSWDRTLEVNLKGTFLVGQRVARVMVEAGGLHPHPAHRGGVHRRRLFPGLRAEQDPAGPGRSPRGGGGGIRLPGLGRRLVHHRGDDRGGWRAAHLLTWAGDENR